MPIYYGTGMWVDVGHGAHVQGRGCHESLLPPSTMQVLGMEFRSSGSIALTHSSNLSGPLDFTRNSNGSFLPLSSSLDLKNAI